MIIGVAHLGNQKQNNKKSGTAKYAAIVFLGTFFCACVMSLLSQFVLEQMEAVMIGFILLLIVILVGILFDIVGTAVAVANQAPFNAKAARKLPGAKKALNLTNRASQVANICNDVIGDICGTVSGGISTALVYVLVSSEGLLGLAASVIMAGLTAAVTVSGKAIGKSVAINRADEIIFLVGQILDLPEMIRYHRRMKQKEQ